MKEKRALPWSVDALSSHQVSLSSACVGAMHAQKRGSVPVCAPRGRRRQLSRVRGCAAASAAGVRASGPT